MASGNDVSGLAQRVPHCAVAWRSWSWMPGHERERRRLGHRRCTCVLPAQVVMSAAATVWSGLQGWQWRWSIGLPRGAVRAAAKGRRRRCSVHVPC